ncbi:MAG: phenylalanine--tRNA ligase beta subunit-related protein [Candidatus Shapirobacteria bacterium]
MKIIDTYLRQWLPNLKASPAEIVEALTLIGLMARQIQDKGEIIYDIEVKQNRGDCLGYYGIVRDLSVYFKTQLTPLTLKPFKIAKQKSLPIEIKTNLVKRLLAYRLTGLKNKPSPAWLKNFLACHEINSINALVDLTNFVMLWYGLPCHAFDTRKTEKLIWEINQNRYPHFTTLDGTKVKLRPENLVVSDGQKAVSLTFIGGQNSGVELATQETIIEMAVYNRIRVRQDRQALKIQTESSTRLEKDLDPELIPQALQHLIKLVLENCGGKITGAFEFYPEKVQPAKIELDLKKASDYAGINIPLPTAQKILERLGCRLDQNWIIPTIRKDLQIEEDLIEEIISFYGYHQIPTDQPLAYKKLPNITPPILIKIAQVKAELVKKGYDEIRSWPLIREKYLENNGLKPIYTQNNVNEKYPVLRNSIICSLKQQKDQYERLKVPRVKFFEIGKIFYQEKGQYKERYSLGKYYRGRFEEINLEADERR